VGGVSISHPGKPWWADEGITKMDVVRYYDRIWESMGPWTAERPLVAERCPDGMVGSCFFQKNFARGLPAEVPTAPIAAPSVGRIVRYVVGGSKRTLLAMVNLGCIAIHVMNCRLASPPYPDWLAFDLDPGSGEFADAAKVGRLLHQVLDDIGLRSYPKTSGGRGLHVFVPLRPVADQNAVRAFARCVASTLEARCPELATVAMSKRSRTGRVFVDWLRNAFGQTIVAPYSVRRRPRAPVSTPLDWDEVQPRLDPSRYNIRTIERRLAQVDPWRDFWRHRQALPQLPDEYSQTRSSSAGGQA
jgi:bifunctional non-homologous end joining protein LigD